MGNESFCCGDIIELRNIEFLLPFEIKIGTSMICEQIYGGGMEIRRGDGSDDNNAVLCTVNKINIASENDLSSNLRDWKRQNTENLSYLLENYEELDNTRYRS